MNIRDISLDQLQKLGMPSIAYFKPILNDGVQVYAIHAADGTPMAIASDPILAQAAIIQHDMRPSLVH